MAEDQELSVRVARLEANITKAKWFCGFLIVVLSIIAFFAIRMNVRKTIQVEELTIRDGSGTVIAHLGPSKHGVCFELMARSGASRAQLCVDEHYGSSLDLDNKNPESSASLTAGRRAYEAGDLFPGLSIAGPNSKSRLNMTVGSQAQFFLGQSDKNSSILLSPGQKPAARIVDSNGSTIWTVPR